MKMKGGLARDTPIPKLLSTWRLIFTWRLNVCPLRPRKLFQLPSGSCILDSVTSFQRSCFLYKAEQLYWNEITLFWSYHSCFRRGIQYYRYTGQPSAEVWTVFWFSKTSFENELQCSDDKILSTQPAEMYYVIITI